MEVTRVIFRMTIATILMALALSQVLLPPHPPSPVPEPPFLVETGGFMVPCRAFRASLKAERCSCKL